jgi:hypothetical protein
MASRSRHFTIAALLCALAVGAGSAGGAAGERVPLRQLGAMTLRLPDLPPGYVADELGCGPVGVEGASEKLARLVFETQPQACGVELRSSWDEGAPEIQSFVIGFADERQAERGFTLRKDLAAFAFGTVGRRGATVPRLGASAVLFHADAEWIAIWRSDSVLGLLQVAEPATQARALQLARRQQAHLAHPRPVKAADFDDLEVPLDDPTFKGPVYWLGRRFDPPGSLPSLRLERVHAGTSAASGPGYGAQLEYQTPSGGWTAADVGVWDRAGWKSFVKSWLGQAFLRSPCTTKTRVSLRHGYAEIYGGYSKAPRTGPCPGGAPDHVFAHVYLEDAVVTVNKAHCFTCYGKGPATGYNTVAGMTTLVRALRRR